MNLLAIATVAAGLVVAARSPLPSDPSGIYARLDAVVLLPSADAPDRVELRGAFAIAEGRIGDYYRSPRWGRVVLTAPEGKLDECLAQWRDLQSIAGTDQVVAFSSRYQQRDVRVVTDDAAAVEAGVMDGGFGIRKVTNANWGAVRELNLLCRPRSPIGAGPAGGGEDDRRGTAVEFEFGNCPFTDPELRFVITVMRERETFSSPLLAPGEDGSTRWRTSVALTAGETVRWSVQPMMPEGARMPVATVSFLAGDAKRD